MKRPLCITLHLFSHNITHATTTKKRRFFRWLLGPSILVALAFPTYPPIHDGAQQLVTWDQGGPSVPGPTITTLTVVNVAY